MGLLDIKEGFEIVFLLLTSMPDYINNIIVCFFSIIIIAFFTISFFTNKNKIIESKLIIEPTINTLQFEGVFNIYKLKLDDLHIIESVSINHYGIICFFFFYGKKSFSGDVNDEFIYSDKSQIPNPFFQKMPYLEKISNKYGIEKRLIKNVFVFPNSKSIDFNSKFFIQKESDFKSEKIMNSDEVDLYYSILDFTDVKF